MRSIPEGIRTVDHREPSSESQVPDNPSVMAQGAMPAPLHRGAFGRPYRVALWGSLMEIATAPRAGNKARPYRHALGFAVGAGFIPARAAVRCGEGSGNRNCLQRAADSRPYRVRCVGVDVLIDPTAQRPLAAPTAR